MSFSAAPMPPVAFYTEQSLRDALAAIKNAVEDCLNQGGASARMADIELQFLRVVANEQAGILRPVLHEPQYNLVWYFLWEWKEFQENPKGTEAEFLDQQREITAKNKMWTPKPAPAPAPARHSKPAPPRRSTPPANAPAPKAESSKAAVLRTVQLATSPPPDFEQGKRLYVGKHPPPRILSVPPHISERTVYVDRPAAKQSKKPKDLVPFDEVNDTDNEYAPAQDKKRKRGKGNAPTKTKKKKDDDSADEMDVDDAEADHHRAGDTKRVRTGPRAAPKMTTEVFNVPCERCRNSVPRLVCRKRVLHSKNAKIGACYFCSRDKVACKGRSDKVREETAAEEKARLADDGADAKPAVPRPSTSKVKSREVVEDSSDVEMVEPEVVKPKPTAPPPTRKITLPSELLSGLRGEKSGSGSGSTTITHVKPKSNAGPASKVKPPRPLPVPTGRMAKEPRSNETPAPQSNTPSTNVPATATKPPTEEAPKTCSPQDPKIKTIGESTHDANATHDANVTHDADATHDAEPTHDADTTHDTETTYDVDTAHDAEHIAETRHSHVTPTTASTQRTHDAEGTPGATTSAAPPVLPQAMMEALYGMFNNTQQGLENSMREYFAQFVVAMANRFESVEQRLATVDTAVRDLQTTLDKIGPMLVDSLQDMETEAQRLQAGVIQDQHARTPTWESNRLARSASAPPSSPVPLPTPAVEITPPTPHSSQEKNTGVSGSEHPEHRRHSLPRLSPPPVPPVPANNLDAQRTDDTPAPGTPDVDMATVSPNEEPRALEPAPASTAGPAPNPPGAVTSTVGTAHDLGATSTIGATATLPTAAQDQAVQGLKPPRTPSRRSVSRSVSPARRSERLVSYSRSPSPRRA